MPNVALYKIDGTEIGEISLNEEIFGVEMNVPVVHQVVKMQLANKRVGTQSALTRAEVSGGGIKPWKQKGTGRARHGSSRSPIWTHGGVVFAPKPRDYSFTVPKKMRRLAIKCALSSKVTENEIRVVEDLQLAAPKTKEMAKALAALKAGKKVLLVIDSKDENVLRASGNIPGVKVAYVNTINTYDIMNCDSFVVTKAAVAQIEEVYSK